LLPTAGGFPIRHYLAAKEPEDFFAVNCALITRLQRAGGTAFLTVRDYVQQYLPEAATQRDSQDVALPVSQDAAQGRRPGLGGR
jgi:hypothetical protein